MLRASRPRVANLSNGPSFHTSLRRSRPPSGPTVYARCCLSEHTPNTIPASLCPPAASGFDPTVDRPPAPSFCKYDFVVIGSGIAGLTYALKVAEHGTVAVVTKEGLSDGCTVYAQGGICAVLDPLDSVEQHSHDTLVAGDFLNDKQSRQLELSNDLASCFSNIKHVCRAVDIVCREGAERVLELVGIGARFTQDQSGNLHLTREGGHSARRIVHAADATGAEIARTLTSAARSHPSITLLEHHMCIDLVISDFDGAPHCVGIDVLNLETHELFRIIALSTLLASGGAGQLYPFTTNPAVATGDGIAIACRAGAAVGNMEFIQFHPTALAAPPTDGHAFLITEAVRGEGGRLYNLAGERFMPSYDARAELAPRDIVARAIHDQLTSRGDPHVLLDISHKPRAEILSAFPRIAAKCATLGLDIAADSIPVTPAQHYICGGVETGLLSETRIAGLFACGEVAFTGVHGANRLASNSLLEALVFGARAVKPAVAHAEHAARSCAALLSRAADAAVFPGSARSGPPTPTLQAWVDAARAELQATMWRSAGIVRDVAGMEAGLASVEALEQEVGSVAACNVSRPVLELRNLVTCGRLVLENGLARHESRGLHFCKDYPARTLHEAHPMRLKPLVTA